MPKKRSSKPVSNGRKARTSIRPYARRGREYQELIEQIGLNQLETGKLFEYAGRTSRRYRRGEGKVPVTALILLRLMASGKVTKEQVLRASAISA